LDIIHTNIIQMELIKAEDIDINDDLFKYSNPYAAQRNAFILFGEESLLYKSTRASKKYMIYDVYKGKYIHFGSMSPPYQDYLKHHDDARRNAYLRRAMKIKGDWFENPYSPNSLSINILWN
jgi:hypothetical protein